MELLFFLLSIAIATAWYQWHTYSSAPHTFVGVVQRGQGQGDNLGARTANFDIALAREAKLVRGLYACSVQIGDETELHAGLLYYGINSLNNQDCLEVHLLDFSGELYGKKLVVTNRKYIRGEKYFASPEELAAQIQKDLAEARSK